MGDLRPCGVAKSCASEPWKRIEILKRLVRDDFYNLKRGHLEWFYLQFYGLKGSLLSYCVYISVCSFLMESTCTLVDGVCICSSYALKVSR